MYKFYLKLFVISGSVILLSLLAYKSINEKQKIYWEEGERNENSTPRSFILPATPAVAREQDNRNPNSNIYKSKMSCMKKLSDLGFDVGDELIEFNAKLKVAIYEFQKSAKLKPSGMLDRKTMEALGC